MASHTNYCKVVPTPVNGAGQFRIRRIRSDADARAAKTQAKRDGYSYYTTREVREDIKFHRDQGWEIVYEEGEG